MSGAVQFSFSIKASDFQRGSHTRRLSMIVLVLHCTHKERRNYAASADSTTLAAICAVLDGAERVMETDLSVGLRDGDMSELGTFETGSRRGPVKPRRLTLAA